jgi:hypothetical protein
LAARGWLFLDLEIDGQAARRTSVIKGRDKQLLAEAVRSQARLDVQFFEPGDLAAMLERPLIGQVGDAGTLSVRKRQKKDAA